MFGLLDKLTAEQLIKALRNRKEIHFEREDFYQKLKKDLQSAENWSDSQKSEFVRAALSLFQGMDGWDFVEADSWRNIWELSVGSPTTLKCLKLIEKTFDRVPETARLRYILREVDRIQYRQQHPIYDLNQTPSVVFQDKGFKLAVINQLMYRENKLHPRFDITLFKEEYKQGLIDPAMRGASPEAGEYLLNLDIPFSLLEKVEVLNLEHAKFYFDISLRDRFHLMIYRWMPGGYIPIGKQAVADLANLPNLREIHLNHQSERESSLLHKCIPINVVEALTKRGVQFFENGKLIETFPDNFGR